MNSVIVGSYGRSVQSIQTRFEQQVERHPTARALVDGDQALTFSELNARANQLAHYLIGHDVTRVGRVALSVPRSADMVVALLGILKAGASCVPIDVTLPFSRRLEILQDSGARHLITDPLDPQLDAFDGAVVTGASRQLIARESTLNPRSSSADNEIASVLYTSGVTGRPKGVLVTATSLLNHMDWMWDRFPFDDVDVNLIHRSYMLVSASWDYWGPLLMGVPGVIVSETDAAASENMWRTLVGHGVSRVSASPPLWHAILDQAERRPAEWRTLRVATVSGEQVTPALVHRWRRAFPDATLLNVYGSTECVRPIVYDTAALADGAERVPIGTPLPNVHVHILDERLDPVAPGEQGELCIAGACVAQGYVALPGLTAERFIRHPHLTPDEVMYRTGDLGRLRADGLYEVTGRVDRCVKIRGYRIELEEVEAALHQCTGLRCAAVVASHDPAGDRQLVAYVVPAGPVGTSAVALRRALATRLPDYMIPAAFRFVDALPLTGSGKTDWAALPVTVPEAAAVQPMPTAISETERQLAALWAEVLGVDGVRPEDDFYESGGHSLAAMRIVWGTMDIFGVELPSDAVTSGPTVRSLAAEIDRRRGAEAVRRA